MPAWLSPFPIPSVHQELLEKAGWMPWQGDLEDFPSDGVFLYDTPDRLLEGGSDLVAGYRDLGSLSGSRRCVAVWRLLPEAGEFPSIQPLEGALVFAIASADTDLLNAYLDLELKADLLGGEPDVGYRLRLLNSVLPDSVIQALNALKDTSELESLKEQLGQAEGLKEQLASRDTELKEAREEAELTLLQLHQVQEELEQYFLANREQQQQLEQLQAGKAELEQRASELEQRAAELEQRAGELESVRTDANQLREQLEQAYEQLGQAEGLKEQLASRDTELKEAREEAELTLLQLHQVQEELEHYFLLTRGQNQQLERYGALQRRTQHLLAQMAVAAR